MTVTLVKEKPATETAPVPIAFLKAGILILEVTSVPFHIAGQGKQKFVLVRTEAGRTLAVKTSDITLFR